MPTRTIHRLNERFGWLIDGVFAVALGALVGCGAAWALEHFTHLFR